MKFVIRLFVIAILMMSHLVSVAHADCLDGGICGEATFVSVDDEPQDHNETQNIPCDCCASCAGHHHIAVTDDASSSFVPSAQILNIRHALAYLSQRYYPPSKPPKA